MAQINRKMFLENVPVKFVTFAWLALFSLGLVSVVRGEKKPQKTLATTDGKPIRKVYIHSTSQDMASSAANQLAQDTCIVAVSDLDDADAVLNVRTALHAVSGGAGLATPNVFGPSARSQATSTPSSGSQHTASTTPADATPPSAATWPGNAGGNMSVSLVTPEKGAQELWEPDVHSGKSWGHQLRIAAGCPVCPDEHFDHHKYKTYRNWIEDKCPAVLGTPEAK